MGNIFPAARLIELLLFGKTRLRIWTFAGVVMLPALLILTFLCVSIFNVARERFGYVHDSFHSMQRRKSIRRQKKGIDTKNRTKIPIHIIDNNLFHHQCITIFTDFFQLKLYARREEERSHFVVIACDRIRLDCIGDNVSHTQRVVSPSIVHILDHFVHFTLFYGVCSMFISMFVCLCVCVKYSGTFLRCGCEFTSFIFQSHFELFTIVC